MNTDGYMNLVGPIGKDPQAIQNLSEYISGEVISATDLQQRVTDALPPRAQLLAGPITSYVEDFITKGANKVLSSPKAYELWLADQPQWATRRSSPCCAATPPTSTSPAATCNLNLLPLISQVLVWVDQRLPGGLSDRFNPPVIAPDSDPEAGIQEVANWSGKPLPSDFGQITLLQSDALGPAQTAVKWFDRLTWILPLVTARAHRADHLAVAAPARARPSPSASAPPSPSSSRAMIVKRASLYLTDKLEEGQGSAHRQGRGGRVARAAHHHHHLDLRDRRRGGPARVAARPPGRARRRGRGRQARRRPAGRDQPPGLAGDRRGSSTTWWASAGASSSSA